MCFVVLFILTVTILLLCFFCVVSPYHKKILFIIHNFFYHFLLFIYPFDLKKEKNHPDFYPSHGLTLSLSRWITKKPYPKSHRCLQRHQ